MKSILFCLVSACGNINASRLIKNSNVPACVNCKFFKQSASIFQSDDYKCMKFGEKNIYNDKISDKDATECRNYDTLCGYQGKHFEEQLFFIRLINKGKSWIIYNKNFLLFTGGISFYLSVMCHMIFH